MERGTVKLSIPRRRHLRRLVAALLVTGLVFLAQGRLRAGNGGEREVDPSGYAPENGDLIFQISTSAQSQAVREVTGSPYGHMGIVYLDAGRPLVFEASATVKTTPLDAWIERGERNHVVVKRLRDAPALLTPAALQRMLEVGGELRGKPYDSCFAWSDTAIYCSELVWKIYDRALGIQIGDLEHMADFDLDTPSVRQIMAKRPECGFAPEETVISPVAMFESELLETVSTR
jgi:hypothetical protein